MFTLLIHHPLIAFVIWTFLAVGVGLAVGAVISHADAAEEQRRVGTDTEVIDFRNAPQSWLA